MKYKSPEKRMRKYPKDADKTKWVKYAIVVPTEDDKEQIQAALESWHDGDADTDYVPICQLCHEYCEEKDNAGDNNIIIDPKLFESLNTRLNTRRNKNENL